MKKSTVWQIAAVSVIALSLTACASESGGDAGSAGEKESYTIGMEYMLKADESTVRAAKAHAIAAEGLGWQIIEHDPAGDPQKATTGLINFATQGVDAVLLAGWESSAVAPGLARLAPQNIPVYGVLGEIESTENMTGWISQSEAEYAGAAAEEFVSRLQPGDKVLALTSDAFTFGKLRTVEFEKAVSAKGLDVVGRHQTDFTNPQADTVKAITDLLNANPDVQGIWTDASVHVPSVSQVLSQRGMCGEVVAVGFYADIANLQAVRDGCYSALVDVPNGPQSFVVFDLLAAHFYDGDDLPATIPSGYPFNPTEVLVITPETVPAGPEEGVDVEFDYVSYFLDRWAAGEYGPENG